MAGKKKKRRPSKASGQKSNQTAAKPSSQIVQSKSSPTAEVGRLTAFLEIHEKQIILVLFLLGFGLRLLNLFEMRANDPFFSLPSVDPAVYHDWAKRIVEGEGAGEGVFFLSPLYAYFLAGVFWLFGPGFTAARVIQAVLGGLNCVFVYMIGKRAFNVRVGALAGFLQAVYAVSIFYEGLFLITSIQTPINLGLLLVLVWSKNNLTLKRAGIAGALLGLSALARPNILIFAGFVVAFIFLGLKKKLSLSKRGVRAAVFCAVTAIVIVPVTIRNYVVGDDIVMVTSSGGMNFYIGNSPNANGHFQVPLMFSDTAADDPIQQRRVYADYAEKQTGKSLKPSEISDYWYGLALDHITTQPIVWLKVVARKVGMFFNHYEIFNSRDFYSSRSFSSILSLPLPSFGLIAPLALLGLIFAARGFRRAYYLYGMVFTYLISTTVFFVLARYRLPAVPVLIVFAAFAIDGAINVLKERRLKLVVAGLVLLIGATSFVHMEIAEKVNQFSIYFNLGNKFRKLDELERAEAEYKKAIELYPDYISAVNNLAVTYELMNDRKKAMKAWSEVKKIAESRGDKMYINRATGHLMALSRTEEMP